MLRFITICIITICVGFSGFSQDPVLSARLKNKQRIDDITKELIAYFNDPATVSRLGSEQVERQIKHWRRWLWYMSSRVGEKGELVNIQKKLFEANGNQLNRYQSNNAELQSNAGSWSLLGPANTTSGIGRVDRLAFHPTDKDIVYAGTTAGGLWRTTDGGNNWSNLSPYISSPAVSGIAIVILADWFRIGDTCGYLLVYSNLPMVAQPGKKPAIFPEQIIVPLPVTA
jgi:hypothetical protein